jgi:hypothetical protein
MVEGTGEISVSWCAGRAGEGRVTGMLAED